MGRRVFTSPRGWLLAASALLLVCTFFYLASSSLRAYGLVPPPARPTISSRPTVNEAPSYQQLYLQEDGSITRKQKQCGNAAIEAFGPKRAKKHKLVQFFMYSTEEDLLHVKLLEHYSLFDYFFIIEAPFTHHGHAKPLRLEPRLCERFTRFVDKIVHVVINATDMPSHMWGKPDADNKDQVWNRELGGRNAMHAVLSLFSLDSNDLILQTDLDEIPTAGAIEQAANHLWNGLTKEGIYTFVSFDLKFYKYSLFHAQDIEWKRGELIKYGDTEGCTFNQLRLRICKPVWPVLEPTLIVPHAGIHLTYAFTPEGVRNKLQSYAHAPANESDVPSAEELQRSIQNEAVTSSGPSSDPAVTQFSPDAYALLISHSKWLQKSHAG